VDDSDPAKVIFKIMNGHVPANVEEAIFQAAHLESRQPNTKRPLNALPKELLRLNSKKRCCK
jgi:hypothetical protein